MCFLHFLRGAPSVHEEMAHEGFNLHMDRNFLLFYNFFSCLIMNHLKQFIFIWVLICFVMGSFQGARAGLVDYFLPITEERFIQAIEYNNYKTIKKALMQGKIHPGIQDNFAITTGYIWNPNSITLVD